MQGYESQEHEIRQMARNHRISKAELDEYVAKTNKEIRFMFPDQSDEWKLWRAEREVWNFFFKKDKFPGRMPNESGNEFPRNHHHERRKGNDENRRHSKSEAITHDQPWVHDLFNPLAAAPPRPGEIDSYKPSSSHSRSKEIDSYRPSVAAKISHTPIQQTSISPAPTHYLTQESFMKKRILGMGVSEEDYSTAHRHFTKDINHRHSIQHVTPQWLLWKKESSVWSHFVPFEPFPEREPVMIAAPPIDNYVSRWKSIENKAMADLIPLSIIEVYYKERLKYAEKHYRQESKAWKLWFAEHEVWIHFFRGIQFHGLEPKRSGSGPTPITSTQNLQVPVGPLSSAKRHPNALPTSDSIDIPGFSTIYQHQEKVMEEKAKKRGIRREFFQYLQRTRDWARKEHPDCTKDVRNHLADCKAWNKFFGNEPFPGIKPFGGHTPECIRKTLLSSQAASRFVDTGNHSTQAGNENQWIYSKSRNTSASSMITQPHLVTPGRGGSPINSPGTFVATRATSQPTQPSIALINVEYENKSPRLTIGRTTRSAVTFQAVSKTAVAQVRRAFESDDARKIHDLEEILKCRLEGMQSPEGTLTFTIKPFQSSDEASFELAFRFLVSWVKTCVTGNIQNISSYVDAFAPSGVRDPGLLTAHALSAPTGLLVNGKYIALDPTEFERIRLAFSKDLQKREVLENEAGCRFILVDFKDQVGLKHLIASNMAPRGGHLPEASTLSPSVVLWHPEEGSIMNDFLEKWTLKVGGCVDNYEAPSIPVFWEEYINPAHNQGQSGGGDLIEHNEVASLPAEGADMDLDDMIMAEAAKAEGLSKKVTNVEEGESHSEENESRILQSVEGKRERISSEVGQYGQSDGQDGVVMGQRSSDDAGKGGDGAEIPAGGEKRKLEDSFVEDDEGEIVEERAEKRAKV